MERLATQALNQFFSTLGALLVSGVVGAAGWLLGNLTVAHLLVLSIAALVLMLCGRLAWARVRKLRFRLADFEKWDDVGMPTIWQAACLWDGIEPFRPITPDTPCYARLQMLKSEAIITALETENGETGAEARASRYAYEALAESLGQRPAFLFPEDRKGSGRK